MKVQDVPYRYCTKMFYIKLQAGVKWVCNDSRNATIFEKIPEKNYMFRPLIEWAIIRIKQENNRENHTT
jgi:hypothetical protein